MGLYIFVLGLFVNVKFVPEVLDSEKQSSVIGKKKKKKTHILSTATKSLIVYSISEKIKKQFGCHQAFSNNKLIMLTHHSHDKYIYAV